MKNAFLLPALASALLAHIAQAAIIPVSEDTYTASNGKIARGYGKFKTLTLAPNAMVLLRFDVNDFAGLIAADKVSSARVILDITKVRKAGGLRFHRVTSEWTESANGVREAPTFDLTPFATLPEDSVQTDQFAMIDLTAVVKQWLAAPGTDFGIAITGTGAALDFASKEGPTEGEPAWLEIESQQVTGDANIAPGVDAAKLGSGSVDNTEFAYLNGVTAPIQTQLDATSAAASTANAAAAAAGDAATAAASQAVSKVPTEPELRIVRGSLLWKNGTITVGEGSGFTVSNPANERYTVTFTQPFAAAPTALCSAQNAPTGTVFALQAGLVSSSSTAVTFHAQVSTEGRILHFVAVGPR